MTIFAVLIEATFRWVLTALERPITQAPISASTSYRDTGDGAPIS